MLCFPVAVIPLRYVPLWLKAQAVQRNLEANLNWLCALVSCCWSKFTNIVTQSFITLQFWKSEVFWSSVGWKRALLPPGILRKNPFLCLFQNLEVTYIPGLEAPSTIFKANNVLSSTHSFWLTLLRLHLFSDSDPSAYLVTAFGPSR